MPDPDVGPPNAEASGDITNLLRAWSGGDQAALDRLAEQVYPELRRIARRYMKNERQANTLQSTALVHEVYLRLVDVRKVDSAAPAPTLPRCCSRIQRAHGLWKDADPRIPMVNEARAEYAKLK